MLIDSVNHCIIHILHTKNNIMENTSNNVAPQNKARTTSRDFFLWLGVIVSLYMSTVSFIILLFEYINIIFKDDLTYYVDPYSGVIRFAIASIIVMFPLYIYLTRLINKDIKADEAKHNIGIRKWLIVLTIFVTALALAIDLIALVNTFLGGEITIRFIAKVLTVLVVVGGIFLYYINDFKGVWQEKTKQLRMIAYGVSLIVLISIVAGFFIMGSPKEQRLLRFDQEKVSDLQSIQWQIVNYWQSKEALPESLDDLTDPISSFLAPTDRQTGDSYVYEKIGEMEFKLCAVFNMESVVTDYRAPQIKLEFGGESWDHGEGEVCFERTIDPELYPLRKTVR